MTDQPAAGAALSDDPTGALLARLAQLRHRVAALVESRSKGDPTAADPLRGLYLSDEAVLHHLRALTDAPPQEQEREQEGHGQGHGQGEGHGQEHRDEHRKEHRDEHREEHRKEHREDAQEIGHVPDDRLHLLTLRLGLTPLDAAVLLIALAPDLDRRFEPLYGYLNDDVSRRRATIGLALDLCALPPTDAVARDRFHPTAPLSQLGLLLVEEEEHPFLSRSLRVPDRLAAHLLGDDTPDAALEGHIRPLPMSSDGSARGSYAEAGESLTRQLAALLADSGPQPVYLREHRDGDGLACALAALAAAGRPALHFTPAVGLSVASGRLDGEHHAGNGAGNANGPVPELLREARLLGCAVVVSPVPERPGSLIRALTVGDVPVILTGRAAYDPQWCERDPLVLDAPRPHSGAVEEWAVALGLDPADDPGFDLAATVAPYRLGGDRIRRSARAALGLATFDGTAVTAAHLRLAARQQSASGLEQHARRIRPDVGWNDLVLPAGPRAHLQELALRARHRDRVLGEWRLSAGGGRGHGVLALFAGESGTGKTLSAEVVAADLGLDLYVVQLSSIVDKYVGETEKNLERIFTEADRTDAVLLFDEADAVFGKRSEVKDSHDRYANLESAYLLQRLEAFDGIAVLTTNLRANIDDAFTRRLDLVVDFPFPDVEQRLALWRHSLAHVPCVDDIDPEPCARDFELAGGSIRSAVVTAAYAAAGRGEAMTTADLLAGARREYRKAGRLVMAEMGW